MNDDYTFWTEDIGGTGTVTSWDGDGVASNTFYFDSTGTALPAGDKLNVTWQVDTLEPTLHACLVCDEKQEHQICKVCLIAVTQHRDELFLKQIKDIL